jgi:predicted AAA+ superfamily ATPase
MGIMNNTHFFVSKKYKKGIKKVLKKYKKDVIIFIDRRVEMLHIKISDDLKNQLKKEAEERGLTLSSYIRLILIGRRV